MLVLPVLLVTIYTVYMFLIFYFVPVGERNIAISLSVCVCVSVCLSVREHISQTPRAIFMKFVVPIPCGRGSVLLWGRCDTGAESYVYECVVISVVFMDTVIHLVNLTVSALEFIWMIRARITRQTYR